MATATTTKTTTPRARGGRATTAKAAPKTATPAPAATEPEAPATADKFVVDLEYVGDTKRYAKFEVPKSLDGTMAGSIYVPLGTDKVKVAIFGVEAADEE